VILAGIPLQIISLLGTLVSGNDVVMMM